MVDPGTASGWGLKQVWDRVRDLTKQGRKLAKLIEDVSTLTDDVATLKGQFADLERRSGLRPLNVKVDGQLGVMIGVVDGTEHKFCPVCGSQDRWVPLQHEAHERAPWRCPACNKTFPGGGQRIPRPSISMVR